IRAQLANYLESQRQVLRTTFLGVYGRQSQSIAFSASEQDTRSGQWRLAAPGEPAAPCVVTREVAQQLVFCEGIAYLISVVPIVRSQDAGLGDASSRQPSAGLLGWLMGGSPLASPTLIASLQSRGIDNPLIWIGDELVHPKLASTSVPPPRRTDGSALEYSF